MKQDIKNEALLYDPIFAKKPPEGWEDSEKGGIFGKAVTKKVIFVLVLVLAISFSLILSFKSISKKKYMYDTVDSGYRLSEFNGTDKDNILIITDVKHDDGSEETEKTVTAVRNYALCCNETIDFIFVGKDVIDLEYNCFYYCTKLKAVFVDEENPAYTSVDGVIYTKDMTEVVFCPMKNSEYRTALKLGYTAPATLKLGNATGAFENEKNSFLSECADFLAQTENLFPVNDDDMTDELKNALAESGALYTIPDSVTSIAPFCFSYCERLTNIDVPDGVKTIGQMAFFKCKNLESIYLPDGLESIGSDAVSYCEKIDYIYIPSSVKTIGHHAFFGCFGVDAVYLGAADDNDMDIGESWLPYKSARSLSRVDTVYGAERRNG